MTEEERKKLYDIHNFLFESRHKDEPTRAKQLDGLFDTIRAGKLGTRALLWVIGFATTVAGGYALIKGWLPK